MNLSLNGEWALRGRSPEGETLSLTAQVPGNVELDLFRAGIEPDPYYGANEYLYKPYEYWDWTFEKTIFVPEAFAARPARLCFEGLNCIADVFVNGEKIGHSENALIPHVFPCGSALRPGKKQADGEERAPSARMPWQAHIACIVPAIASKNASLFSAVASPS